MAKRKRFGEILVEARVVSQHDLNRALERQRGTGRRLGQVLEEMGVITERDIAAAIARQFGFKTVSKLSKASFSEEILSLFDAQTAINKLLFPLKKEGKTLYLAMVNPLDIETLDSLAFKTGMRIIPCVTTPTEIQVAVNRHYFNILENVELKSHDPSVELELQEDKAKARDTWWSVLVVEDNDMIRSNIVAILKREGYRMLQASNGEEGVALAVQHQPHLIIADTNEMPKMDGYEMFRAIQSNQMTRQIPLIGLSEVTSAEEEAKLLEMGYHDFIAKPINPVRLVARIKRAFKLIYGDSLPAR